MPPNKIIIIPPANDKEIADDDKGNRLVASIFDFIIITGPPYSGGFYYLMTGNAM
jgi:hypothetical protein